MRPVSRSGRPSTLFSGPPTVPRKTASGPSCPQPSPTRLGCYHLGMAKKKRSKKSSVQAAPRLNVTKNYGAVLTRLPPPLIEELNAAAWRFGVSREALIRQVLAGALASFKALAENPETKEQQLFQRFTADIAQSVERAAENAVERVLTLRAGTIPPKGDA